MKILKEFVLEEDQTLNGNYNLQVFFFVCCQEKGKQKGKTSVPR